VPNAAAVRSLIRALETGSPPDLANIIVGMSGGGPNAKLNGPQVALALDLEGLDSHATVIPGGASNRRRPDGCRAGHPAEPVPADRSSRATAT